jgi:hypothetical protein
VRSFQKARSIWRTAGFVYLVQLVVAFVFLVAAERTLVSVFGSRPIFDRAVAGDLSALMQSLSHRSDVVWSLVWTGLALAGGYALVSLWLIAILIDALAGAKVSRGRIFLAYLRLELLSLIPYAVAIGALFPAFNRSTEDWLLLSVDRWHLAGKVLLGVTPGVLLFVFTACAVDYARIAIALDERPRAFRALMSGVKTLLTRRRALPQYLVYLVAWIGISALYVGISGGVESALVLFALRQITSAARFGARVVTYAAQTDIYQGQAARAIP